MWTLCFLTVTLLCVGELHSACPTRKLHRSAFSPRGFWEALERNYNKCVCVCCAIRKWALSSMAFLFLLFSCFSSPRLAFLHIFLRSWQNRLESNSATRLSLVFVLLPPSLLHSSLHELWWSYLFSVFVGKIQVKNYFTQMLCESLLPFPIA